MKLIIGLIGKKRSGKDTLCRIIQARYPEAIRVSIADPIKADLARRFEVSVEQMESEKEKWRPALQWWGDFKRAEWTSSAFVKIEASSAPIVVITDARYPDQFDLIRSKNGILVRVERPWPGPVDLHASETNVDWVKEDLAVFNPGDASIQYHLSQLWDLIDRRLQ